MRIKSLHLITWLAVCVAAFSSYSAMAQDAAASVDAADGVESAQRDAADAEAKAEDVAERDAEDEPDPEVVALLEKIESASAKLDTLQARMRYTRLQGLTGDEQRRFGNFYYAASRDERPTRFAVLFDRLVIDDRVRPMQTWFVFDGKWLLERDHEVKTAIRRELVPEDAKPTETLSIGQGQTPIPLKLKADQVLAQYRVTRLGDVELGEDTLHYLKLTPRQGDKDATPMDLYFNSQTLLLQKIVTEEDGDEIEIIFPTTKINPEIAEGVFDTGLPKTDDGWQVQEVPIAK